MSMDPRIAARRRDVIEGSARRSLLRLAKWLAILLVLVGLGWLVQSDPFRVAAIEMSGVARSGTESILSEEQVLEGRPMVLIRPGTVEEALATDPWIIEATVGLTFPDLVEVVVRERSPAAWLASGSARLLLAADGVVVPGDGVEDPLPLVSMGGVAPVEPGEVLTDPRAEAALTFLTTLDPLLAARGVLLERAPDDLWFSVPGLDVRLGRPIEMAEKAAALTALLDRGVPPGSEVNLIAPTRPAVSTPDPRPPSTDG
ncbi:MAG: FtsQ-type POTRA domain-containing protein [Acidimicrobiia bacterium]|nr:FtsQ-type POTRA domain-containing protein [Acidimicrobiia bacterium]